MALGNIPANLNGNIILSDVTVWFIYLKRDKIAYGRAAVDYRSLLSYLPGGYSSER